MALSRSDGDDERDRLALATRKGIGMPVAGLLYWLAVACLGAGAVHAQPPGREAPPAVVMRQFLSDLSDRRWTEAATALDLHALGSYRDALVSRGRRAAPVRELTIEDILRAQPDLPRAVAEYQLSESRRFRAQEPPGIPEFPDVSSYDSLATLPLTALGVSWLQGRDYRESMRRDLRRLGCPPRADTLIQRMPLEAEVLGAVAPSDSLAYVLFLHPEYAGVRTDFYSLGPLVAQLRHTGAGWRIIPTSTFLTHVNTISQLIACPSEPPRR